MVKNRLGLEANCETKDLLRKDSDKGEMQQERGQ
jgi:hypothetical protein